MRRVCVVALAVIVCLMMFNGFVMAEDSFTIKVGYFASKQEAFLDEVHQSIRNGDVARIKELTNSGLVYQPDEGLKVNIVKYKLETGKVKVKLVGDSDEEAFWMVTEAIE